MGGVPIVAVIKPTDAEVTARLIEIGSKAYVPNPHTIFVVEDPSPSGKFFKERSDVDNICYAIPVSHLKNFPFSLEYLESKRCAFYCYDNQGAALEDAKSRLENSK